VRIGEGCSNRCSFCAIPLIRGPYRSREEKEILGEIRDLAANRAREIILVAQDTTRYGTDRQRHSALPDLLRKAAAVEGVDWLRVLYCYPDETSDELLDVLAETEGVCPYLDIPLQHISADILHRMRRRGTREDILRCVRGARQRGLTLRTSLIVGFPGETEEQFARGLEFVEKMNFSRMHVFPYSKRSGTPAAERKDQIQETVKKERAHRMQELAARKTEEFHKSFLGKTMRVLFETNTDGVTDGLTDNYIRVYTDDEVTCGEIYTVELQKLYKDGVWGRVTSL
jgi:threonylcarbamoyladenosine tRNA methylthiotransferase MtaB